MSNTFNLREIFAKQFGYAPLEIEIKPEDVMNQRNEDGQYGPYYAKDVNGREVFMPVTLGGVFLPYTWMSVSIAKTIVETDLTEIRGSVKEFISMQDYKFNLKGLFVGQNGKFPESDIEIIRELVERNETLEIKCPLTDLFLLTKGQVTDRVVINSFNLAENPGVKNVRGFSMELTSDRAFELELTDEPI